MSEDGTASADGAPGRDHDLDEATPADHLDDDTEQRADQVMAELAEARRKIAEVPASQVVTNHAMGLFELAAIHLSAGPGHLPEAALAIDAMGAIVEGLADRLGVQEPVLRDALNQIRLAFVQVKQGHLAAETPPASAAAAADALADAADTDDADAAQAPLDDADPDADAG